MLKKMNIRLYYLSIIILSCAWGTGLGFLHLRGDIAWLDPIEATLTNFKILIRGRKTPPHVVSIVAIDDATLMKAGSYPLDRTYIAEIINKISLLNPKVIALDMLFVDPTGPESDAALVMALAQAPSLISGAAIFSDKTQRSKDTGELLDGVPEAIRYVLPLPKFRQAAALGIVNVATDGTGTPNFIPLLYRSQGNIQASFALRAVSLSLNTDPIIDPKGIVLGDRLIATDRGQKIPVDFYGPRGTIKTTSAVEALENRLRPEDIADKIVVIGVTFTGGGDVFHTPFDQVLPGVEVLSTAITHLATGDGIVQNSMTRRIDASLAGLLPIMLIGLLAWRRSRIGLTAMVIVLCLCLFLNMYAYTQALALSAALPLVAAAPPVLIFGLIQLFLSRQDAQRLAEQSTLLQAIEAPGLSSHLARDPTFLLSPVEQDAAIVFIDLSGFTGVSEKLGPQATRDMLNGFYTILNEEAMRWQGAITSFMGDGAMILFGLPQPSSSDAYHALHCCMGLCEKSRAWLATLPPSIQLNISFKLGAHFGTVIASRLGSSTRQQITATGDTVNVASRLMEIAAKSGAELAISARFLEVSRAKSVLEFSDRLKGPVHSEIRGRAEKIVVWLWHGAASDSKKSL